MKKFFYTMLLLAAAGMTMTAFVSCEEKDDDDIVKKEEVKEEKYLAFKYWVTNDVLEVVDVKVSGISDLKFTEDLTLEGCPGKLCDLVELTGQQAEDADITVKLELKPNWKELVKDKKEFNCGNVHAFISKKDSEISFKNQKVNIAVFSRNDIAGDVLDQGVETTVPRLGFEYKAKK